MNIFWNGEGKWKLTFYVILANRILQWDVGSYIMGFTLDLLLRWSLILNHFNNVVTKDLDQLRHVMTMKVHDKTGTIFQIWFIWDLISNIIIQYAMQDTFFRKINSFLEFRTNLCIKNDLAYFCKTLVWYITLHFNVYVWKLPSNSFIDLEL